MQKQKKSKLEDLKKGIEKEIISLSKLDIEEKNCKNKDIKSMIQHYLNLTDKMEDRRTRIYNFTLQYLIICLTGLGLLLSQINRICDIIFYPIMVVLIIQIISSVIIIIFHEKQSAFRYSFLDLGEYGNKWKWFYYGNKFVLKIKTGAVLPSKRPDQTTNPYLEGLKEFIQNYKDETIDEELSDNIQQLYLLLVHNYYKNRFHLQLTGIRLRSLEVTFVAFLIAIAIIFIILKYVN